MDKLGLMLHIIGQESENDQGLEGGDLGPQRKLYYRELVARFAEFREGNSGDAIGDTQYDLGISALSGNLASVGSGGR